MQLIKKLKKSASIYIGSSFANEAIPFLLLPILTRYLSPSDYGIWSTFIALSGNVTAIIGMGTVSAIIRAYFDRHRIDFPAYIGNSLFINGVVCAVSMVICVCAGPFIGSKLGIPVPWLYTLPIIGLFTVLYNLPTKLFIYEQKPFIFAALQFSYLFFEIALSIFFVVGLGFGWEGRAWGVISNRSIFFFLGVFLLLRRGLIVFRLNKDYIRRILWYGIPMVFYALGITVLASTDRICLNMFVGPAATGVYSVGFAIAGIIVFFNTALILAWEPILFEALHDADHAAKRMIVRYTYGLFAVIAGLAVLLVVAAPFAIHLIVGSKFDGALTFIPWLALANIAHGMYVIMKSFIMYQKNTSLIGITAVITIVVNIALNFVLIGRFGALGAAQATFLTFAARFLLVWYLGNRVFPMPWFSFITQRG